MSQDTNIVGLMKMVEQAAGMERDIKHIMASLSRIENSMSAAHIALEARVVANETDITTMKAALGVWKWIAGLGGGSGFMALLSKLVGV